MKRTTAVFASSALLAGSFIGYDALSYAATGDSLILGKTNKAGTTTAVVAKKGPALELKTKKSAPPLKVSSTKRVAKLNADKVDGLEGASLQYNARVFQPGAGPSAASVRSNLPGLSAGQWHISYAATLDTVADDVLCFVGRPDLSYDLLDYGVAFSGFGTASASGIVTVAPGETLNLTCTGVGGNVAFASSDSDKTVITAVPVDSVITTPTTVTEPRAVPRGAVGGARP